MGQTLPGTGGGKNFFRIAPMGSNLGSSAIDFIADQVAPHFGLDRPPRYAVAYVDDPYGREVGDGAMAEIRQRGQPLVGTFPYDTSTVNYEQLAAKIAAAHPDPAAVIAWR